MNNKIHQCLEKIEITDGRLLCRWNQVDFFIRHSHDFWEIPIQIYGTPTHNLNGEMHSIPPQACILITPRHIHQIQPCDTSYKALNIVIADSFMKSCCDNFSPTLYNDFLEAPVKLLHLSNGQFSTIKDFQLKLLLLSENSPQKITIQKMLLSYMIELFYNNNFINTVDFPPVIKDFIHMASLPEYIDLKPSQVQTLTHYSYSRFSALFKQTTNQTLNEFLTETKMNFAYTQLIRNSNISIIELSAQLGYSLSHFCHVFKKYYGVSPSTLRNSTK